MNLGEAVRQIREEKKISLAEIAQYTKIHIKQLEYLERGDWRNLPPPPYTKGMIRRVATLLDLDKDICIKQYEKERLKGGIAGNEPWSLKIQEKAKFIITPRIAGLTLGLVLFFSFGFYFFFSLKTLFKSPTLVLASPAEDLRIQGSTKFELFGEAEVGSDVKVNGEPISLDITGKFSILLDLKQGLNILKIEAVNRLGKKTEITRKVLVE